jgi:hypothetical protein
VHELYRTEAAVGAHVGELPAEVADSVAAGERRDLKRQSGGEDDGLASVSRGLLGYLGSGRTQ